MLKSPWLSKLQRRILMRRFNRLFHSLYWSAVSTSVELNTNNGSVFENRDKLINFETWELDTAVEKDWKYVVSTQITRENYQEEGRTKLRNILALWNSNIGLNILPNSNAGLPKYIHCSIKVEARVFLSPLQLRENAASFKGTKKENKKSRAEIMKPTFLLYCFLILQILRYKLNMNYTPKDKAQFNSYTSAPNYCTDGHRS
jgi:hypothetical protein